MPLRNFAKIILNALLNFIYPPICSHCSTPLQDEEKLFCTKCWKGVRRVESYNPEDLTAASVWDRVSIEKIKSIWWFEDFLQMVIHELKYKRKLTLAKRLGNILAKVIREDKDFINANLLIPVPLHTSKQRERGYNQSLLLAKVISQETKLQVEDKIIKRSEKTQVQAKLNAAERMKNVSKAFQIMDIEQVKNKEVILVDDVCTTGATLFACADVLLAAGCSKVFAVTVAKATDLKHGSGG